MATVKEIKKLREEIDEIEASVAKDWTKIEDIKKEIRNKKKEAADKKSELDEATRNLK